ncbi:MAG TPA: MBL fold metallo-hydrolase, partial [Blastocatellia bacterium]
MKIRLALVTALFRYACLLLVLLNAVVWPSASAQTRERTTTKVAEGVYVIRHRSAPTGFPQSNTTVIIGDREVFVVDSCYLPSTARGDIAQIREWTDKPVRYLLNTHWHNDHVMGNSVYREAFPSLAVIAHKETAKDMDLLIPQAPRRGADFLAAQKRRLESGKSEDGKPLTQAEKSELSDAIALRQMVVDDYKSFVYQSPNITFDKELSIDLGNREVQVKYLGRGNTTGDAIVYLPKEKILVTGDLLVHPLPFTLDGYPSLWIQTLERIGQMDAQIIVPGHGPVMRDKTYLYNLRDFIRSAVEQVNAQLYRIGPAEVHSVEEVRGGVD